VSHDVRRNVRGKIQCITDPEADPVFLEYDREKEKLRKVKSEI
jgi:hypothetical protein